VWHQEEIPADWKKWNNHSSPKERRLNRMQQLVWNNITVSARQGICQSAAQPHARCRRSVAPTAASRVQAWKIMY